MPGGLSGGDVEASIWPIHKAVGAFSRVRPSPLNGSCSRLNACVMRASLGKGVFTRENSHGREFHTGMTFWFRIAFTLWLGHFISRYLKVHFKYTSNTRVIQNRKRYACASRSSLPSDWFHTETCGHFAFTWYRCEIWYRNSRHGSCTGANSRRGDSRRHDILWWYDVNKYRAMRGNRSELAPAQKSPRCHVNTP